MLIQNFYTKHIVILLTRYLTDKVNYSSAVSFVFLVKELVMNFDGFPIIPHICAQNSIKTPINFPFIKTTKCYIPEKIHICVTWKYDEDRIN